MRLIGYQVSVPAHSQRAYSLDLSHLGKWVIWARMDGLDLVEFRHGRRLLASGAADGRPIWICEPTRRKLDVVLINNQDGDLTGTLGLYVDSADYWAFIDEGFRQRTRLWPQITESSPTTRVLLRNRRKTRDLLVGLIWADMGRSVKRLWGPKGDLIIEATEEQPTFSPIRLEERLSYGDELRAEWWTAPGAMWPWWATITYWEVPTGVESPPAGAREPLAEPVGEEAPEVAAQPFPTPVEPRMDGPMSSVGWAVRTEPPRVGPVVPYVQPVPAPPPAPEPPFLAYPGRLQDRMQPLPPILETAEANLAVDLAGRPAVGARLDLTGPVALRAMVGLGPFSAHLLRMDTMGRARITEQAVLYRSGKVEATDASATTITPPRPTHRVALKAVAGAWEVKALTIYDVLAGRTMADADTIYLDEGDALSEPLEAVALEVKCPGASASSPGTLYYYLGM